MTPKILTTNEIRKKFLDFFASKNHTVVQSASLVPPQEEDQTVLFTTAGMQQFKRQFLGQNITYRRAASSQKCLRTDDLEKVGKTPYHHTFFEMLGNFSFGDYFKKEAIAWAWEFLTKEVGIPAEKLWVSVYEEDTEAEQIWLKDIGIPVKRLVKLSDKSNFWPSEAKTKGPNGPCGPCSEIFFDYGAQTGCGKKDCSPECDCGRFSEVWNLVFTQFNRKEGGVLEPLPNKNIDTGMGLERLTAVIQGKTNNFESDLFSLILSAIDHEIGKDLKHNDRYIIADHMRAIVFGICDGVMPSNDGRGYIMKRLIVDIADLATHAGHHKAVIYKLVPSVIQAMKGPYPEIAHKENEITSIIQKTEDAYMRLKKERIPELKSRIEKGEDLGQLFFTYRDTYGLTLGAIEGTAISAGVSENKIKKAEEDFKHLMEEQKNRSRTASKMTGDVFTDADMNLNVAKTIFTGYDEHKSQAKILKLFLGQQEVKEAKKGDEVKVILDRTPFYAESGGQIGDTGTLTKDSAVIKVTDTQRIADIFIHIGRVEQGSFQIHDSVVAEIDTDRRLSIMRNHTATHLLQAAMRQVLGPHVKQQGSLVSEERLRFDFTHPKALTKDELNKIEQLVNDYILSCHGVERRSMTLDEAKTKGALAFFAEKYGDTVNVVSVGSYSKELCGGTHLNSVGQIGLFKIIGESAIAQGIRRIEAKTGQGALQYVKQNENRLEEIAKALKSSPGEVVERLQIQTKRLRDLEKETEQLRFDAIKNSLDGIIEKAAVVHKAKVVAHVFSNISIEILRKIADLIKQKEKSSVAVLGSKNSDGASILICVTDDLVKKDIQADALIKEIAPMIEGSGGGRPQLAQAGTKDSAKLEKAIREAEHLIKARLEK